MGAWGVETFENDDAADWVYQVEAADSLDVARSALDISGSDYVEVPEGSVALAAAEVVAASSGQPHAALPDEVVAWVAAHGSDVTDADRQLAKQAVARVGAEDSELVELWADADEATWRSTLEDLDRRLG